MIVPAVELVVVDVGGLLDRCMGAIGLGFSSGSVCGPALEITGGGTSLVGVAAGLVLVDGLAAAFADPMGKSLSPSVSRIMVLTAYLTALFSAFAMMAAAVP